MQSSSAQAVTGHQVRQIVQVLMTLPPEKVSEVWDFVAFLQERYVTTTFLDVSDMWTDQDLADITAASLGHARITGSPEPDDEW